MGRTRIVRKTDPNHAASKNDRRQIWIEILEKLNLRLVDLQQQTEHFQNLLKMVESRDRPSEYSPQDVCRWFAAFGVMAIRRELKKADDCHSLMGVLEEMAASRENVLDFRGQPIDLRELREDRKCLKRLSAKIEHIADKEVAHATIAGVDETMRPTVQELFECIDAFNSIAMSYRVLLSGEALAAQDADGSPSVRLVAVSPQNTNM
jgi:hypothetical protein